MRHIAHFSCSASVLYVELLRSTVGSRGNPLLSLPATIVSYSMHALSWQQAPAAHTVRSAAALSCAQLLTLLAAFPDFAKIPCTASSLSLFATVQVRPSRTVPPFSAPQTTLQRFCTSQCFEARSSSHRAAHSLATAFRSSTKSSKLRVAPKRFHGAIRRCG